MAIAGFALASLLTAQLMLSSAIHGTSYRGPDGGMIQSTVLAALRFGGLFDVTNINPLQGVGSQMLPKNAWANPAFWPFAIFKRELATELSSAIALGCFALACYIMARCFDLPVVPSALAAQLCIVLFAPTIFIVDTPRNFSATPADAVTYAPYMVALGLLARLQPASPRQFVFVTIGIAACLFYSIYCDPAFTMIPAVSWAVAFATVLLYPPRLNEIAIRGAAVVCCLGLLVVSGAAVYLYSLSEYSARIQYAAVVDRIRNIGQVTVCSFSSFIYYFYIAFALGLAAGLLAARGRARTLVMAAALSWLFYLGYSVVYLLLLDAPWVFPMPLYVEQCLFVLLMTGAVAGGWALLQSKTVFNTVRSVFGNLSAGKDAPAGGEARWRGLASGAVVALSIAVVALTPLRVASFAIRDASPLAQTFYWPWADEPELIRFLTERVALKIGSPFQGSVNFLTGNDDGTIDDLWSRGIPTVNEYSQTVTAPSFYFMHALLKRDVRGMLNRFEFYWRNGSYSPNYWPIAQLLGVRFAVERWAIPEQFDPGLSLSTFPYHVPKQPEPEPPGLWYVYELPRPNLGNYSPTEVTTARSGAAITAAMSEPGFDFTKRVVLSSAVEERLVTAQKLRLSVIRNGLHLSGHSDAASLVVLPQEFSHCLRARDNRVRLVRADLVLTGVIFSGDVDTDIVFEYGILSPWCRLADLADIKSLDLEIDLRRPHLTGGRLFPDWRNAVTRLEAAIQALERPCNALPRIICERLPGR
jgi:hypothetical protein